MDKLLFIAQPSQNYSNYFKFKLENDIWELLSKIAISSPICLTQLLQKLKFSFTFAKNFENYLGSQWIEFIQKTAKKNKFFWEEHVEIMNFVNNLWLIVQEDGIRNGLVKIFNDGKCVYHNLRMSVLQDFEIKRVGLNVGFLKKRPILTVFDKKEKAKSVIFAIKKNLTQASSYNYIFKLLLSYMKEKQLPIRVKLRKFECMSIRNKGEIGSILEYTEVYPYEYKDIIISHAGYSLLLFFLGLQDTSPLLFVSETQKVILDSTKLKIAGKHHKYFKVHRDCDLEKFKFYIISGFLACREIFENLLWTMQESFWAQHKLHFYLSMPITSIISKLNSRIGKSNN